MGKINIYDKMKIRQNNKWKISPWLRRHPSYLKKSKASERTTERPNILVMPHQPTNEKAFDRQHPTNRLHNQFIHVYSTFDWQMD